MNAIKKITARAKQLQRLHPNAKWINLIKTASAEYRSGHKHKAKPKSKPKKVSGMATRKQMKKRVTEKAVGAGLTISAAKHFIREELKEKMSREWLKQQLTPRKSDKRYHGKQIRKYKSELKKLD